MLLPLLRTHDLWSRCGGYLSAVGFLTHSLDGHSHSRGRELQVVVDGARADAEVSASLSPLRRPPSHQHPLHVPRDSPWSAPGSHFTAPLTRYRTTNSVRSTLPPRRGAGRQSEGDAPPCSVHPSLPCYSRVSPPQRCVYRLFCMEGVTSLLNGREPTTGGWGVGGSSEHARTSSGVNRGREREGRGLGHA